MRPARGHWPGAAWRAARGGAGSLDPGSMLHLYKAALRLRRPTTTLRWHDAPDGVLAFETSTMRVAANLTAAAVPLTWPDSPLLSSSELAGELPPDTTVWWTN